MRRRPLQRNHNPIQRGAQTWAKHRENTKTAGGDCPPGRLNRRYAVFLPFRRCAEEGGSGSFSALLLLLIWDNDFSAAPAHKGFGPFGEQGEDIRGEQDGPPLLHGCLGIQPGGFLAGGQEIGSTLASKGALFQGCSAVWTRLCRHGWVPPFKP